MRIEHVHVHNFRSIEDEKFDLGNYSLFIGPNNSGKSNVFDALRVFYEKDIKHNYSVDLPKFDTKDEEVWIKIRYQLDDHEFETIKDEYKRPDKKLIVKKFIKSTEKTSKGKVRNGIYAKIKGDWADEQFYGARNVQQGKFGDLIYIPAVSKLDDETKLTGPSPLRDLINNVLNKIIKSSPAFSNLEQSFNDFNKKFKTEETSDKKSLEGLEREISTEIAEWNTSFRLDINPIDEKQLVKNLITFRIQDELLNEELPASQFGQGFQRHLIFSLIKLAAQYTEKQSTSNKKEFKPNLTLILFEEPEAFLHPDQQISLSKNLQKLSKRSENQVIMSSHSSNFVSHNTEDIPSIVKVNRPNVQTNIGQISTDKLEGIFGENQEVNELVKGLSKYEAEPEDLAKEMEAIKYFLWLDPGRSGLFFAKKVLLVEGPTELFFINYLIDEDKIQLSNGSVFVLDCLGKFNIHRFMNLLGPLKIDHSIIFDEDENRSPHDKINQLIHESKNNYTHKIDSFENDLESFLEVELPNRSHRKPQHLMYHYQMGNISEEKIQSFCKKIEELFI